MKKKHPKKIKQLRLTRETLRDLLAAEPSKASEV
jgi:hypothetical protein